MGAVDVLGLCGRIEPGGGGGAERRDCDGGGPERNCADGGLLGAADPFTPSRG
jgi:hypothetical protein